MIKLIASDIDGTLVEDGKHYFNPELYEVILKLRDNGVQFAAATGRQWASIESLFEPVKKKIFYISDNGAYIGCCGRALYVNTMERELSLELIRDIKAAGLDVMISGPDTAYLDSGNNQLYSWMAEDYKYRVKRVDNLLEVDDQFIKISAYRRTGIESFTGELMAKYGDRLKITISGDMWMDAMAPGINKGAAIKLIQESLNIKPEETMVFGDQMNDIEMMRQAYYSFAIGNARDEVKKVARFQADTNIRDGVLKVLKCLL